MTKKYQSKVLKT